MAKRTEDVKSAVRDHYAAAALKVLGGGSGCCGPDPSADYVSRRIYEPADVTDLPRGAVEASLGCGNPTALAELSPGETVLDLGSGGGIDVLLSARRVGPTGKAYGLDMTDEMLELARTNQREAGLENVEFLKGEIEDIPLPDVSLDVVISNCVINLSADKDRVFQEVYRVLRPGGRLAVSDIVATDDLAPEARADLALWSGCVAGALTESAYRDKLRAVGFIEIALEETRAFDVPGVGAFRSAFVRAEKPRG
ncbi:MAG: arsenite methyltransferase [Gemmatimonadota bacterium]|nr:arsenite methyltransferase [Gemmatimonadota bacterium]MDH3369085.1 arsenite methyltransferase [Gemmatimonadota bacterium]MDH3477829.1 arsenite methyltransferase [Gemmatimonadota bacterium]MDH3570014.1 arsenite methyltransferase [Gemmatimonadota bacterium]MDH5549958.1 arsenite methyltransferase [Gemmatimonadota bacterium]